MLKWALCGFHKKHGGTRFAELVFLHQVGSAGHVVHSGASEARNVDALFFMLGDEDTINMDTPTVVTYNSVVKLLFSIIIFNTYDEWMLHHDMCSMSFMEVLTWIKEGVDLAWKEWIMKHLNWRPNPRAPYASTRSPRYLWYKETRRLRNQVVSFLVRN
jgi:hypothetical protein